MVEDAVAVPSVLAGVVFVFGSATFLEAGWGVAVLAGAFVGIVASFLEAAAFAAVDVLEGEAGTVVSCAVFLDVLVVAMRNALH